MSGEIWVVAEPEAGSLAASVAGVATLGRRLARDAGRGAVGVLVGRGSASAGRSLAGYLPEVVAAEIDADGWADPADVASVVVELAHTRSPSYVLVSGTPWGRAVAGSIAGHLRWGVLTGAQGIRWDDGPVVETIAFSSETHIDSRFTGRNGVIVVQPNLVEPVPLGIDGTIEHVAPSVDAVRPGTRRHERIARRLDPTVPSAPSLETARIVVAGGAGMGGPGGWELVEHLAGSLGGAVGATRSAVDKGWAAPDRQIGQSGKSVRPELYIGLGTSGQILHRLGVRGARTVVAVTLDPEAPFRGHADVFVVADVHELVPALLAEIEDRERGRSRARRSTGRAPG